jgi:hypothetical protein
MFFFFLLKQIEWTPFEDSKLVDVLRACPGGPKNWRKVRNLTAGVNKRWKIFCTTKTQVAKALNQLIDINATPKTAASCLVR